MPRKRDLVISNLTSKGFRRTEGDHIFLVYYRQNGLKSAIRTKISRGSSHRDISDNLLGQMAGNVRLTKARFLDLIDCPLDQTGYEAIIDG